MRKEIWKPIPGFIGFYEASSLGRIRSVDRMAIRSDGSKINHKGRIRKFKLNIDGYLKVTLNKNGFCKSGSAHRFIAMAFYGKPKKNQEVNHKDGNKLNNIAKNLEWVTRSENLFHANRKHFRFSGVGLTSNGLKINREYVIRIYNDKVFYGFREQSIIQKLANGENISITNYPDWEQYLMTSTISRMKRHYDIPIRIDYDTNPKSYYINKTDIKKLKMEVINITPLTPHRAKIER